MARILSGDPRLGPLAGQGYAGPLAGGWSPDFSEASPAALDLNQNPMAVDRMGMLRQAMEGAAARYRVAQPVGSDPTYLHDVGRGYAGPLGGVVGDLVTPPNFNTGDPWQDGLNAGMMVGMPIKAYHGSPHDFERFDMSKIGTGEGAQVYGHGLYFAENPAVAAGYRKALAGADAVEIGGNPIWKKGQSVIGRVDLPKDQQLALDAITRFGEPDAAVRFLEGRSPQYEGSGFHEDRLKAIDLLKSGQMKASVGGKSYEVSINADPEHFLDWDKPLSEQPEIMSKLHGGAPPEKTWIDQYASAAEKLGGKPSDIKAAITDLVHNPGSASNDASWDVLMHKNPQPPGFDLNTIHDELRPHYYDNYGGKYQPKTGAEIIAKTPAEAEAMRAAGIKGIRYKDAGSRFSPNWRIWSPKENGTLKWSVGNDTLGGQIQHFNSEAEARAFYHDNRPSEPTHNYVVFDDKIIDILKKYGIAGLTGGAAATGILSGQQQQPGT